MGQAAAHAFDPPATPAITPEILRELAEVVDYIARMRRAIGALRANEFTRDRIPMAHDELGSVVNATASATNTIMSTAEAILALPENPPGGYRAQVEDRINGIFEACAFQDITGQRISKVAAALGQLEKRLQHFTDAVRASDGPEELDAEEAARRARAEALMLNGPQKTGAATSQDEIDALFD
jgi:chemotaxis protein CheZ